MPVLRPLCPPSRPGCLLPARLGLCLTTLLLAWLLALSGLQAAQAATIDLSQTSIDALGLQLEVLPETDGPLSLARVRALAADGAFRPGALKVPTFGIGAPPVWLHLRLDNPTRQPLQRRLLIGTSWIDSLDVYLIHNDQVLAYWQAGDGDAQYQHPAPGRGYLFNYDFPPGPSELYIRAATPDPLVLPVRLLSPGDESALEPWRYSYGFLYGFLFALLAYNAMLSIGLRERSYFDYALYLGSFILLNLAYTGHGYTWLWPDSPELQRFVILWLMVLFACSGLRFALHFLDLATQMPRLARVITLGGRGVLLLMLPLSLLNLQREAALLAFSFALVFSLGMVALGLLTLRRGQVPGRYFLLATCCLLPGEAISVMAVWGAIPFNHLTYRAVELGLLVEATLLALALGYQIRQNQQARQQAENLARIDPLTGLLNRRAFLEQGEALWSSATRNQRPLAVIMLDLDHFKRINDSLGHAAGDQALVQTAQLLGQACRRSDLAARWGGEEFILLLPEASLQQATALAERLREQIAEYQVSGGTQKLPLQASLGVAERHQQASLEALIGEADHWLYAAKQSGRNRVVAPEAAAPA